MTRNLRYLMKDYECNEYKYKIENQKKDERQLSRVFFVLIWLLLIY